MITQPYTAFWGEMSTFEHFVHIYEQESLFLDTLADYIGDGLRKGETSVAILTPGHRAELERRLLAQGVDVPAVERDDQLILLDAKETIAKFMVNDWPDDRLFSDLIISIVKRATQKNRKVRAFGEMVALMWAEGQCAATVRLEHLWHGLCQRENLPLFCAYPKTGFSESPHESIAHICSLHSRTLEETS